MKIYWWKYEVQGPEGQVIIGTTSCVGEGEVVGCCEAIKTATYIWCKKNDIPYPTKGWSRILLERQFSIIALEATTTPGTSSESDKDSLEQFLVSLIERWVHFREHPDCYSPQEVLQMSTRVGNAQRILHSIDGNWRTS